LLSLIILNHGYSFKTLWMWLAFEELGFDIDQTRYQIGHVTPPTLSINPYWED